MLAPAFQQRTWQVPVIKTIASRKEGIDALMEAIVAHQHTARLLERKSWLFTERAYRLIQKHRMASIDKEEMRRSVRRALEEPGFNLFTFVQQYL